MELTSNTVDRTAGQLHEVIDAAAAKANAQAAPAIDRAARTAHDTVDKVAQAAAPAADWLNQNTQQLVDDLMAYVRRRPLVTVGVALAAGYLAGRLAR